MTKKAFALLLAACVCAALFGCGRQAAAGGLAPGVYTGAGAGHGGDIEIQLTVGEDGRIAAVAILSENETPSYAAGALEALPALIAERQSLGVDAAAGATISRNGVMEAVADAIAKAGGDPEAYGYRSAADRADESEIVITGLPEELVLSGASLRNDYELTELDTVSINSRGTEKPVHAKGVLLETILQRAGASLQDYACATVTATDGYEILIPESVLRGRDILLAFEINGEAIEPRAVVPEERAMYWVKFISEIALEKETGGGPAPEELRVVSLRGLISQLRGQAEDYKYYDAACRAIPLELLLARLDTDKNGLVTIVSADGLEKTEKYDTFAAQLLLIEGSEYAPMYIGPNLPEGMRVKNVSSIQVGDILLKD
ncbi:MAG: FMN-binding protein [Oscillospiraceae bacterium]|nr:FMN-binding protein [Oscillospiraceae bacterium]